MTHSQPGILASLPDQARYISLQLADTGDLVAALRRLQTLADGKATVVALGQDVLRALGHDMPGLRAGPVIPGSLVPIPCHPVSLWLWLRGSDRGELLHRERQLVQALQPAFARHHSVEAFLHEQGRDLTGYEDGTENPQGDDIARVATVAAGGGDGLEGSSFVAVQQWLHDFEDFDAMSPTAQDMAIGRRRADNEELDEAPDSAHVKRTAQESFSPEAFVWRRSMPWVAGHHGGLMFVAFGSSLDAFEAQLTRMSGAEDGIVDALFRFSRPVNGAYLWCPPLRDARLDLARLGL